MTGAALPDEEPLDDDPLDDEPPCGGLVVEPAVEPEPWAGVAAGVGAGFGVALAAGLAGCLGAVLWCVRGWSRRLASAPAPESAGAIDTAGNWIACGRAGAAVASPPEDVALPMPNARAKAATAAAAARAIWRG